VFEMLALRKIIEVTRQDRRQNVHINKTLDIYNDMTEPPAERFPDTALCGRTAG